ncbi:MAG: type I glutamate--ammonia ligase, partial [Thermoprotei archaeon]
MEQAGVKFFEAGFLDLEGNMRLRIFPVKVFDKIASEGYGFDGYSTGFVGIEDSDLVAIPDLSTLRIYSAGDEKRALVICDIYKDDKPLEIDPRYMLRTFVKSLTYSVKVGLEPEFYLLEGGNPVDQSSYMYSILRVNVHSILTELVNSLQEAHIEVTLLHHEVGPGQFEITLPYGDPVEVCDNYVFLKHLLRVCTNFRGLGATFMPKPFTGKPGNGLHIHISAIKRDAHLFGKEELSEEGMYFMGGLLKYARSICLYTNSTVNSYKRL